AVYLGLDSFAPMGLASLLASLPTACAVGCIPAPLCGYKVMSLPTACAVGCILTPPCGFREGISSRFFRGSWVATRTPPWEEPSKFGEIAMARYWLSDQIGCDCCHRVHITSQLKIA